jgi:hypothetical protein
MDMTRALTEPALSTAAEATKRRPAGSEGSARTGRPSVTASVRNQNGWRNLRDAIKLDDYTYAAETLRLGLPKGDA